MRTRLTVQSSYLKEAFLSVPSAECPLTKQVQLVHHATVRLKQVVHFGVNWLSGCPLISCRCACSAVIQIQIEDCVYIVHLNCILQVMSLAQRPWEEGAVHALCVWKPVPVADKEACGTLPQIDALCTVCNSRALSV